MKTVVVDFRISKSSLDTLKSMGYSIIKTQKNPHISEAICGHPDMVICKLKNHDFVINPTFRGFLNKQIQDCNLIEGASILGKEYPHDIAYNCALVGDYLFCREKYTDCAIIDYCRGNGIKILDTKQGYAKCSICIVSDNAIITADKNIYGLAAKNNIDVLMTTNEGIVLKGFSEGFFGGATGLLEKDLLAVNGDFERHKDCVKIKNFCANYGVKIISLSDGQMSDIGSIIRL